MSFAFHNGDAMSVDIAEDIYDALVKHAGAPEDQRYRFIRDLVDLDETTVWFVAESGFSATFQRNDGTHGQSWLVDVDRADNLTDAYAKVDATNAALAAVRKDWRLSA